MGTLKRLFPKRGRLRRRRGSKFFEDGFEILRVAAYPEGYRPNSHDARKVAPLWPVKLRHRRLRGIRSRLRPLLEPEKREKQKNLWFQAVALLTPLAMGETAHHGP